MSVNDGSGEFWVESDPANSLPAGGGALELRDLRLGVRLRAKKEHVDYGSGTAGGEHVLGSARAYGQVSAPTTKPDLSTPLDADDYGRLWIDADNRLYIYILAGWTEVLANRLNTSAVITAAIASAAVTVAKIGTDLGKMNWQSYVGGTNPKALTFSFSPSLVVIFARGGGPTAEVSFMFAGDTGMSVVGQTSQFSTVSLSGATLTLSSVSNHFNGAGITYHVLAFGQG